MAGQSHFRVLLVNPPATSFFRNTPLLAGRLLGSERVLNDVIKKKTSLERVRRTMEAARDLGIQQRAFYVIGFPQESVSEMKATLDFAFHAWDRYGAFPTLFFATPLLGTELLQQCKSMGIIGDEEEFSPRDWALATNIFGRPLVQTGHFSMEDLRALETEYCGRVFRRRAARRLGRANLLGLPAGLASAAYKAALRWEARERSG